jgi:hypothetical protein
MRYLGLLGFLHSGQDANQTRHAEAEHGDQHHSHDARKTDLDIVKNQHSHVQDVDGRLKRAFATTKALHC